MNKIMIGVGVAAMLAGCAFNPEAMPLGPKDSMVYVDKDAPETLAQKEKKAKIAVITSLGDYKDFKQVGEALDSSLNAQIAGFSFFQVVDRKSTEALIRDAEAIGADPAEAIGGVEANFIVVARIASLIIDERQTQALQTKKSKKKNVQTQPSSSYSAKVTFDFRWISKATKRVVMTESIKREVSYANSKADVVSCIGNAAEEAVNEFCAKIAVKYAPPARVLDTRGDGKAARISIGTNYGVTEGTDVCFYEIVDNSDVGGEKRDMRDIAKGTVEIVEEKSAWVEVKNHEKTNVRKGVYVRVLGLNKDTPLDKLLGN